MSLFPLRKQVNRKPLRLLILTGAAILMLSGCGASKYEAVDLSMPGSSAESVSDVQNPTVESAVEEIPTIRLGESAVSEETVGTETEAVPSHSSNKSLFSQILYYLCDSIIWFCLNCTVFLVIWHKILKNFLNHSFISSFWYSSLYQLMYTISNKTTHFIY